MAIWFKQTTTNATCSKRAVQGAASVQKAYKKMLCKQTTVMMTANSKGPIQFFAQSGSHLQSCAFAASIPFATKFVMHHTFSPDSLQENSD